MPATEGKVGGDSDHGESSRSGTKCQILDMIFRHSHPDLHMNGTSRAGGRMTIKSEFPSMEMRMTVRGDLSGNARRSVLDL